MNKSLANIFAINQSETNIDASIAVEMSTSEAITIPRNVMYENRMLGVPRLRQLKVTNTSCLDTLLDDFRTAIRYNYFKLLLCCVTLYISRSTSQNMFFKESYPSSLTYLSKLYYYLRNLLVTLIYRTIILLSIHSETTLTLIG